MKHRLAWFVGLFLLLLSACGPEQVGPPSSPDSIAWRTFDATLHVDERFTAQGRAEIVRAARRWYSISGGRVSFGIVFDLNADNVEELSDGRHYVVIATLSDASLGTQVDAMFPDTPATARVLAATVSSRHSGLVVIIVDRISPSAFGSVVTHELGHVLGLPDLPTFGSVMSGAQRQGDPIAVNFTAADVALCQVARLCP